MLKKVTNTIYYVGANDHDVDLFEGQYVVPNGMAYNSYVILDEKIAVMDTIDASKTSEWLANVAEVLAGRKPDYLVVQHMEPTTPLPFRPLWKPIPRFAWLATSRPLP